MVGGPYHVTHHGTCANRHQNASNRTARHQPTLLQRNRTPPDCAQSRRNPHDLSRPSRHFNLCRLWWYDGCQASCWYGYARMILGCRLPCVPSRDLFRRVCCLALSVLHCCVDSQTYDLNARVCVCACCGIACDMTYCVFCDMVRRSRVMCLTCCDHLAASSQRIFLETPRMAS